MPSRTVWIASTIGMPARTNAAIWREKCMISCRLTCCFVISILLKLRFSEIFFTSS